MRVRIREQPTDKEWTRMRVLSERIKLVRLFWILLKSQRYRFFFSLSYDSASSFTYSSFAYTVGDPASFCVKSLYRYAGMSLLAALISN